MLRLLPLLLLLAQTPDTYTNPVMPGDFSDLDAIRVGSDYYAISSTMQFSPGMAILHSKDLVNWRIVGHAVDDLTRLGPELNWDRMNRPGKGIWAGAIRFHDGKYWICFGTPDEGLFMTTATNPAGPWAPVRPLLAQRGWDDPCPFWDDDGTGYIVASNFADGYKIHVFRMDDPAQDRVIHQSRGSEANKMYRFNALYYHLFSHVTSEGRVVMMERAATLDGPWELKQIDHVNAAVDREPNQGGLIQLPSGGWWFVTHQGKGEWEGRPGNLLPVTWEEGWPMIAGFQTRGQKPITGFPATSLFTSDDFSAPSLKPEWEWNYQPRAGAWSLTERPGFLRLHAFAPLRPGDFSAVGDVLTQRSMRGPHHEVTVKLDLAGMTEGQEAGLAHFAKTSCRLGVLKTGAASALTTVCAGRRTTGPAIPGARLWLRSDWDFDGISRFSWSADGRAFQPMGDPYQMTWGSYRGDRIGIYTFNETGAQGYLDVDGFSYN